MARAASPLPVVVITGASRGLGAELARQFSRRACRLALCARSLTELEKLKSEIAATPGAPEVFVRSVDLLREEEILRFCQDLSQRWGRVDILINSAGVLKPRPLSQLSSAEWDEVHSVNLKAPFLFSREIVKIMRAQSSRGTIFNVSSLAGISGRAKISGLAAYTTAKSGLTGFTEALAAELKPDGIRVLGLAPGAFKSAMLDQVPGGLSTKTSPAQVASLIVSLCLDEALKLFQGRVLEVDTNEDS